MTLNKPPNLLMQNLTWSWCGNTFFTDTHWKQFDPHIDAKRWVTQVDCLQINRIRGRSLWFDEHTVTLSPQSSSIDWIHVIYTKNYGSLRLRIRFYIKYVSMVLLTQQICIFQHLFRASAFHKASKHSKERDYFWRMTSICSLML